VAACCAVRSDLHAAWSEPATDDGRQRLVPGMSRRSSGARAEILALEAELAQFRVKPSGLPPRQFRIAPLHANCWGVGEAGPMARPNSRTAVPIGYANRRRSPSPTAPPHRHSPRAPLPPLSRPSAHMKTPEPHTDTGFSWYDAPDVDRTDTLMGVDRRRRDQAREEARLRAQLAASPVPSAMVERWDRLHPHNSKALPSRSPSVHTALLSTGGSLDGGDEDDGVELTTYRLQFGGMGGPMTGWPRATSRYGMHRDKTTEMRDMCIRGNQAVLGVIALPSPKN
jgi:hypothetical protein